MKHHAPRKRATAKSRASKRAPLATLRNPKPHKPAPWAPPVNPIPDAEWYDEFEDFGGDVPPVKRSNAVWYWIGAFLLAVIVLAWWRL